MSERRSVPFKLVAAALSGLVLLAIGFGVYVYFRHVRYERVAAQHLPADVAAAARLDVERILLFEPVRRHFLPLVSQVGERPALPPRLTRIQERTGLKLGTELRELALGVGPGPADWVLILGGLFDDGVVPGIAEVLRGEGLAVRAAAGGRGVVAPGGWALGQAADGVLVLASSDARLRSALEPSEAYRTLGLAPEGAGAFVLTSRAAGLGLEGVERGSGTLTLGETLGVEAAVTVRPGLEQQFALVLAQVPYGAPKVQVAGAGRVQVRMELSRQELDRLAAQAAERVRRAGP